MQGSATHLVSLYFTGGFFILLAAWRLAYRPDSIVWANAGGIIFGALLVTTAFVLRREAKRRES